MRRVRMSKRPVAEAEAVCFLTCTKALSSFYRHPRVGMGETERVLAMLALRWTRTPAQLRLKLE